MQQSSRWSGDEITREASTSSTVIGLRYFATGFIDACRRIVTATSASCSGVVPYSYICRCATIAYAPTVVGPNGISNWSQVSPPPPPAPSGPRKEAIVEPNATTHTSHSPAVIAAAACAVCATNDDPPIEVEST